MDAAAGERVPVGGETPISSVRCSSTNGRATSATRSKDGARTANAASSCLATAAFCCSHHEPGSAWETVRRSVECTGGSVKANTGRSVPTPIGASGGTIPASW